MLGGGGVLGAALLARALACGRFGRVQAVVAKALNSALRGFEPLPAARLGGALHADTALIVFERARRNNGRDEAFVQPQPEQLPELAAQLRHGGVRRLLVVVPHAPALLPQALKAGLASLDEGRVAALGFEQLLFLRTAQAGSGAAAGGWAERAAAGWLSQLAWMVPQREQPVRALRLAELVIELAWRLPHGGAGHARAAARGAVAGSAVGRRRRLARRLARRCAAATAGAAHAALVSAPGPGCARPAIGPACPMALARRTTVRRDCRSSGLGPQWVKQSARPPLLESTGRATVPRQ